jgi:hypothetical protein
MTVYYIQPPTLEKVTAFPKVCAYLPHWFPFGETLDAHFLLSGLPNDHW